jgi:hypothetical protein
LGAQAAAAVEVEDLADEPGPVVIDDEPFVPRSRVYPSGWTQLGQRPEAAWRSIPATTRSMIISRSNSAKVPSICSIARPAGEDVSNASVAETNATPRWVSSSTRVTRSAAGEPVDFQYQQDVDPVCFGGG